MRWKLRDRPLLYLGDVSSVEQGHRARREIDGDEEPTLSVWMSILITFWLPAIVLHELTHYVVARLFGIPIAGVVFFQYSTMVGGNLIGDGAEYQQWQREVVQAAPLAVCGPLGIVALQWTASAPSPTLTALRAAVALGFVYCAIPDQLRNSLLRWWDHRG